VKNVIKKKHFLSRTEKHVTPGRWRRRAPKCVEERKVTSECTTGSLIWLVEDNIISLFRLNDMSQFLFIYLFLKTWYITHHFVDNVKVRSSFVSVQESQTTAAEYYNRKNVETDFACPILITE